MLGTFVHILKNDGFLGLYSGVRYLKELALSNTTLIDLSFPLLSSAN